MIKANENGEILIPFEDNQTNKNVIVVHKDFATKGAINIPCERYELKQTYFVNTEALVPGRKAKVTIRSRLFQNNENISLKKFKKTTFILNMNSIDGTTNSKTFDDVELSDSEDYIIEFLVPSKIKDFSVIFEGTVKFLNSKKETVLRKDQFFAIDRKLDIITTPFMETDEKDGYVFVLRGKNGEPIKDCQVTFNFYDHLSRTNTISVIGGIYTNDVNLWTNEEGKIILG